VSGEVRDALNDEGVRFGYIEMSQPGNRTGEVVIRGSNGCPSCYWGDGRFDFIVTTGRKFTLHPFVVGFEEQVRELTANGSLEVAIELVPKPVTIRIVVVSSHLDMALQCFPARVEFLDGPNAGRVTVLDSGTQLMVEGLQPTDSTVRVTAPGYFAIERVLGIRPSPDYPDVAGEWTYRLACLNCANPDEVSCGG
jgi:hypothetical protein